MAFDLQTLNITFGDCSKSIIKSGGGKYSATQIEVTRNAALSIARRNALLQLMRAQLEAVLEPVKRAIIADICPTDEDGNKETSKKAAWQELVKIFKETWNVEEAALIEIASHEDSQEDALVMLIGIRNAIRDGAVPLEDVFGNISSKPHVQPSRPKPQTGKGKPKPAGAKKESQQEPEQTAPEEEPPAGEEPGEEDEFVGRLRATAQEAGLADDASINGILFAEYGFEDLNKIPESEQSRILDHFEAMKE
jgi:hypothetical protein